MTNVWSIASKNLDARTMRATLSDDSGPTTYRDVVELWRHNKAFRAKFAKSIAECPFDAFFWEMPPVARDSFDRPFEYVLVDAPALARVDADPGPFQSQFASNTSASVVTFPNLGGDAILVVPAPVAGHDCYAHLAQFLKTAPSEQVDEFWRCTGLAMAKRIGTEPTWLSTAGMGVSWLHLRLDSRPKYYRHTPYASEG